MIHRLKVSQNFFDAVSDGSKPFEVRKDDRGFEVGHGVDLRVWDDEAGVYDGEQVCRRIITYILPGGRFGLSPGYCVLGFGAPPTNPSPQKGAPPRVD